MGTFRIGLILGIAAALGTAISLPRIARVCGLCKRRMSRDARSCTRCGWRLEGPNARPRG